MTAPLIADIQSAVCAHFGLPRDAMTTQSRFVRVARPRQIAMYLAKGMTLRTLPEIGRKFGNRDHSTVIHAVRRIKDLIAVDSEIGADVRAIRRELARQDDARNGMFGNGMFGDGVSGD